MSYDFAIIEKTGPADVCACGRTHPRFSVDLGSPTYNLGDIFRKATDNRFAQHMEMPLVEARDMWRLAAERMIANRADYVPLEPPNKWGDLDGAISVAQHCARAIDEILSGDPPTVRLWEPLADEYPEDERVRIVDVSALIFTA